MPGIPAASDPRQPRGEYAADLNNAARLDHTWRALLYIPALHTRQTQRHAKQARRPGVYSREAGISGGRGVTKTVVYVTQGRHSKKSVENILKNTKKSVD